VLGVETSPDCEGEGDKEKERWAEKKGMAGVETILIG
jgi:hypothetical protein